MGREIDYNHLDVNELIEMELDGELETPKFEKKKKKPHRFDDGTLQGNPSRKKGNSRVLTEKDTI